MQLAPEQERGGDPVLHMQSLVVPTGVPSPHPEPVRPRAAELRHQAPEQGEVQHGEVNAVLPGKPNRPRLRFGV